MRKVDLSPFTSSVCLQKAECLPAEKRIDHSTAHTNREGGNRRAIMSADSSSSSQAVLDMFIPPGA